MKRVTRETGADGIRLDEHGHAGSACFSNRHEHTFAEPGCTEWQRGVAEATRLVRQAMDEVDPDTVRTTEHPGYDFLMAQVEGCITNDLTVLATPLRPMECNIQRFYFPECKFYELDHRGADLSHRKRLLSAVGSFGSYYPPAMDTILRDNADAFNSRDCRPLVPTLAKDVYANRFSAPEKTLWTIYNGASHAFVGEVLTVDLGPEDHVVDSSTLSTSRVGPASPTLHRSFGTLCRRVLELTRAFDMDLSHCQCRCWRSQRHTILSAILKRTT